MTSSVPGLISWTIILLSVATFIARVILLFRRSSPSTERLVTYALGFAILAAVFREEKAQNFLSDLVGLTVGFTRQLGTTMIVMAYVPLVLLLLSAWARSRVSDRWIKDTPVWLAGYISIPLMLVFGTHARSLDQYVDRTEGWQTVAYFSIFSAWCAAVSIPLVYVSVRDLVRGKLRGKHIATYIVLLVAGAWATEEALSIFASSVFAATGTGTSFVEFRFAANENNFVYILLLGAMVAIIRPIYAMLELADLDPPTRSIRKLQTLREDLVATCKSDIPGLDKKYHDAAGSGRIEALQRITVEIRDCLLVLGRFAMPIDEHTDPATASAIQVATALDRKRSGGAPGDYIRLHAADRDRDLTEEVRALNKLACRWESAKHLVASTYA
ncbi:hypothetical protein HQO83_07175 [Rhodococcus fascians]|nr:hypothetical protein [Rhodococcus fascians]